MSALPLLAPRISEALAAELLDRGASSALYRQAEWNGLARSAPSGTGDVLAWALVAFFLLTLGVIAGCILALRSRPQQPTPEQLLIEEVQRDEDALAGSEPDRAPDAAPWEKPADWWKRAE